MSVVQSATVCHLASVRARIPLNGPLNKSHLFGSSIGSSFRSCRQIWSDWLAKKEAREYTCLVLVKIYCAVLVYVHSSFQPTFAAPFLLSYNIAEMALVFVCVCVSGHGPKAMHSSAPEHLLPFEGGTRLCTLPRKNVPLPLMPCAEGLF